jgi:ATP-dependent RNA helicase DeaD
VYVHRIGRTGRAGREGTAITLVQPREHGLLKAIEKVVKQKIESARIPTVADLRARRMETLAAALREALVEDDFGSYRTIVQTLAQDFDPLDVAAAAAKLAAEATMGEESEENDMAQAPQREERSRGRPERSGGDTRKRDKPSHDSRSPWENAKGGKHSIRDDGSRTPKRKRETEGMTRLVITAGEQRGIRPKDLVGAIAGEADIPGTSIGAIQIGERHSVVEVPESVAEKVIRALSKATLKGQRVTAKREK